MIFTVIVVTTKRSPRWLVLPSLLSQCLPTRTRHTNTRTSVRRVRGHAPADCRLSSSQPTLTSELFCVKTSNRFAHEIVHAALFSPSFSTMYHTGRPPSGSAIHCNIFNALTTRSSGYPLRPSYHHAPATLPSSHIII